MIRQLSLNFFLNAENSTNNRLKKEVIQIKIDTGDNNEIYRPLSLKLESKTIPFLGKGILIRRYFYNLNSINLIRFINNNEDHSDNGLSYFKIDVQKSNDIVNGFTENEITVLEAGKTDIPYIIKEDSRNYIKWIKFYEVQGLLIVRSHSTIELYDIESPKLTV